jgi:microcystin-dependent protein
MARMAAVGVRYTTPDQFEVNQNGVPIAGAQLFFYETGTTTPQNTYQDVTLSTPNVNPVIADANGRFGNIWLIPATAYAVSLWTAPTVDNPTGSQIWTFDPVGPASGGAPTDITGIIGEVRTFAGPSAAVPAQWYLCYGQAVSRTTYASLFAIIGTTWGIGDGSSTFNLPDLRGRAMFGVDAMGGTPANRITSGVAGFSGTLGSSGGSQNVQVHGHAVSDPTHTHTLTDPGHNHGTTEATQFFVFLGSGGNSNVSSGSTFGGNTDTATDTTGITIAAAATGITVANYGSGTAQNVPPGAIMNMIIYAGA